MIRLNKKNNKGQALTEYAVFSAALLGIILGGVKFMLPEMIPDMLDALQAYIDGFYFILTMPFP